MDIIGILSQELGIQRSQAESAVALIDAGNTIPFIARYRKEATGELDDTQLRDLDSRLSYLRSMGKRREEISAAIEEQGAMTDDLADAIAKAVTLATLEDIYRPYRPKRKTRASVARERGLAPLADSILAQEEDPLIQAPRFVDEEKGVATSQDVLAGAMDIVAEMMSDNAAIRGHLRDYFFKTGLLVSKLATGEAGVYEMYAEFSEAVPKLPGHRILAINRGERENILKVSIGVDSSYCINYIIKQYAETQGPCYPYIEAAAQDSFDRLIFPSLERETRAHLTEQAEEQAIRVFALNLQSLLMQPPVKGHAVLGLDPAYRTGCKIAVVDETGRVLDTTVVYPTPPQNKTEQAKSALKQLIQKHGVTVIAIGNGTASKESEIFVADLISELDVSLSYMVVSEAGASVYSASKLAAEEFPEYDVSLRSAISIARRLQDPLAELVKIDPKAIGVGQYQHDMPKTHLDKALGGVVEACVNTVGVDLNTASHSLLSHVAGVNASVAKNIVKYREETGRFTSRKTLLKVPKLGKKAFEQCAGFLRIPESDNIFDNTAVHPESYTAAQALLEACGFSRENVRSGAAARLDSKADSIGLSLLARQTGVGEPTLRDIIAELQKPGRDPRDSLPQPVLRTDVLHLEDIHPGMVFTGTVRNVIDFGAFVDIGVHQDGLVHISQISDRYIKHPSQVLKVGDIVQVKVLDIDLKRARISLSMRDLLKAQGT